MNKKMHSGSILLFSVMLSFPVMGQTGTGENLSDDMRGDQLELDPLVVVASKSPRPLSEIAAQVTVIDAADIRVGMAEDVDGMLKYEPGLEMETAGTRFGATSINIRGIGGNRVAVEIDGHTGAGWIRYRRVFQRRAGAGGTGPDQAG